MPYYSSLNQNTPLVYKTLYETKEKSIKDRSDILSLETPPQKSTFLEKEMSYDLQLRDL